MLLHAKGACITQQIQDLSLSFTTQYFIVVHNHIQTFYEGSSGADEDSNSGKLFPQDQLAAVIGDENIQHCPALIHLVLTDAVYTESAQKDGKYLGSRTIISF